MIRATFAVSGFGNGFANNKAELIQLFEEGLAHSKHLIIEKSLKRWKEVEYEVVREVVRNSHGREYRCGTITMAEQSRILCVACNSSESNSSLWHRG